MLRLTPGALSSSRLEQRPAGLPPDLCVHGGVAPTRIDMIAFQSDGPVRRAFTSLETLEALRQLGEPVWLRIRGLADRRGIEELLEHLGLPPPLVTPLLLPPQRPQVDCLEEAVMVVVHRMAVGQDAADLISDQVALLLVPGLLVSVEESAAGEPFPDLTAWLLSRSTALESHDLDSILHFLIDDLLDDLFPILERISASLDQLEEQVLAAPSPQQLNRTFDLRGNLRTIRSLVWPLRHQIRILIRERLPLLSDDTMVGFQEMAELVELLHENCELLRNQCDAIGQAYAASVANRMNQVMKTLTILTSIFAPLTLIAGIYGMNFENMPELRLPFGYFGALFVMALVAAIQSYWLWRRGWFQDWTSQR